ncbi:MAG: hypothetical protein RR341_05005 [Bacteroidales bacterium]
MRSEVEEAITQIIRTVRTKNDAFLVLCSLNLLNAAVKMDEYKGLIGYGLIKPAVVKFIQLCTANEVHIFVEELNYNTKEQCAYIRCYGIQFSFHNIGTKYLGESFTESCASKKVPWDGVRLQPVALDLYNLATECLKNNICDAATIKERVHNIINSV